VTNAPGSAHLARFRAIVAARLGLQFEESRSGELAEVFEKLGAASPGGLEPYLRRLEGARSNPDDVRALARHLTVGETYFFRNPEQLRAFAEVALPQRMAARATPRNTKLRILCAGCASGEEAYSLALIAGEQIAHPDEEIAITAVDVNPAALERAAAGRYSAWSLRETPADVRRRWFEAAGREFIVHPAARSVVRFEERNLADEVTDLWLPGIYDVIFCRNVLMYFTPQNAQSVVARIGRSLVADGYLFLGHAESLRDRSEDFDLCQSHNTFYYQRKGHGDGRPSEVAMAPSHRPAPDARPDDAMDVGWIESVGRSSERIRELTERSEVHLGARAAPVANPGPEAMDLLARERFAEALELLDHVPHATGDADLLLLRAVLLTHSGRLDAAETVCSELRGRGLSSAGAHYLLALCREGAGDLEAAAENDQVAAYLDPDFAMPRLHLGLLARRAGNLGAAQRELEQALVLLATEDASRILLFGGGFTREALLRLCRAELRAAGAAP
jgi:chemotaxis protein methyltransferase CheR